MVALTIASCGTCHGDNNGGVRPAVHDRSGLPASTHIRALPSLPQAIQQLTKLAPATALLLKLDASGAVAEEQEVAIALVQRGDRLKVVAGTHAITWAHNFLTV